MIGESLLKKRVLTATVFAGGRALEIEGSRLYLNSVEESPSREPNKASLTVYNLGAKNRGILSAEHRGLEIVAGYYPQHGLVFRGETYTVRHEPPSQNSPEWVTTIEAADGWHAFESSWASLSWPAGTPLSVVVTQLGQTTGLAVKTDVRGSLAAAWCCSRRTADALTEFCGDNGLTWHIYQGVIEVLSESTAINRTTATAVRVSADSGMIGSPALVERKPKGGRKRFGVSVKTLMDPRIRPHGLVEIITSVPTSGIARTKRSTYSLPQIGGVYRVGRVARYGSLETPDFYTEFETESFYA